MNTRNRNSAYLITLAFVAGVIVLAAMVFGLAGSANASERVTGPTGVSGETGATPTSTLSNAWWKKNNKAIKLITKQCKYRPAYRLLIKIRKPGLAVRGYLHMGWLAIASYGVSKTHGANWRKPNKKRKAQRRKVRRKMAKASRKWTNKGLAAREVAEANDYEGIPYVVGVDSRVDTGLTSLSAGINPLIPCKK